jgi:hypothetical protein
MSTFISAYLIEHEGIDWSTVLSHWSWLLPADFTLWLVNRFCDLFIVLGDGTVHMLDVGVGGLSKVADSRDDFGLKLDEGETANQWLMIPLVDSLVSAGVSLERGQCYAFKTPPVLGGGYTIDNCGVLPIADYLQGYAALHKQLVGVPDGANVALKVILPA